MKFGVWVGPKKVAADHDALRVVVARRHQERGKGETKGDERDQKSEENGSEGGVEGPIDVTKQECGWKIDKRVGIVLAATEVTDKSRVMGVYPIEE